jgi:hypothetical protein
MKRKKKEIQKGTKKDTSEGKLEDSFSVFHQTAF